MITIKHLTPDDWAILKQMRLIALKSDPDVFGSSYEEEIGKGDTQWRTQLDTDKAATFIIYDSETPIGMTGVAYCRDDPHQKTGQLWGSWLMRDCRGRGLSQMMLEARLDWVRDRGDIDRVWISHRAGNAAVQKSIVKNGFIFTHAEPRTWRGGIQEECVYYMLFLSSLFGPFPIETKRLLLRPVLVPDSENMTQAKRETWPQLQKWMIWAQGEVDPAKDVKNLTEQQEKLRTGENCMLVGIEKETNTPVIFTGLHRPDWENRVFEIGYWVRASAQGKGYAQEATSALTAHAFQALNASKVLISAAKENPASLAVINKCGFVHTHDEPPEKDKMGQATQWFGMLRSDD